MTSFDVRSKRRQSNSLVSFVVNLFPPFRTNLAVTVYSL
jgi:hypothetical protein